MSTVTAYPFTQPTPGLTVVVPILDPTGFVAGGTATVFGIGVYTVCHVDLLELPKLTLLNPYPSSGPPGGTIVPEGTTIS